MSSKRTIGGLLAVAVGLSGCCGNVAQTPLVWLPEGSPPDGDTAEQAPRGDASQLEAGVRADVDAGHRVTAELVASTEFRARLAAIAAVYQSPAGAKLTGVALRTMYLAANVADDVVCYHGGGDGGGTMAKTGFGTCAPHDDSAPRVPIVTLYKLTLDRLASPVVDTFACGLNTLAHEWVHRITADQRSSTLTDDDHDDHATPVASYVIGALAQCLYLRRHYLGQAAHRAGRFALEACVEAVGTNTFFGRVCDAGWGERFVLDPAGAQLW